MHPRRGQIRCSACANSVYPSENIVPIAGVVSSDRRRGGQSGARRVTAGVRAKRVTVE